MDGQIGRWMDGWMCVWVDGWMDEGLSSVCVMGK